MAQRLTYKIPIGRYQFVRDGDIQMSPVSIIDTIESKKICIKYFQGLGETFQERICILCLNTKKQPISWHVITVGVLDACIVSGREIFRPAILSGASSILLTHNHPSGNTYPSPEDIRMTGRTSSIGSELGIPVIDHIIVGETSITENYDAHSLRDSHPNIFKV